LKEHIPVLPAETIKHLDPKPGENFIDATLGYAGHAKLILEKTAPDGRILGLDQDEHALTAAQDALSGFSGRVQTEHINFTQLGLIVRKWPVNHVDGVLIDLGVSTPQLTGERGFSFKTNVPLDMRQNPRAQRLTAADVINKSTEKEIAKILFDGEERFAKQIAKKIIEVRRAKPIATTQELVEIIHRATPPAYRATVKTHFATATFRALRIAVNDELENLKKVLPQAKQVLSPGGRLVVISFQSLEDRIVKHFFKNSTDLTILTNKPVLASAEEINENPNARSAKLRAAIKK